MSYEVRAKIASAVKLKSGAVLNLSSKNLKGSLFQCQHGRHWLQPGAELQDPVGVKGRQSLQRPAQP